MIRIFFLIALLMPFLAGAQETKDVRIENALGRYVERYSVLKSDTTIKHGPYRKVDFFNGALQIVGQYKMGKKDGRWQEFSYWDVFMVNVGNYKDGKRVGSWLFFSKLNVKEQEYDYTKKELVLYAKDDDNKRTVINGKDTLKNIVMDRPPLYIGGNVTVMTHILSKLTYPEEAEKKHKSGIVTVACLVDTKGHLSKTWIKKGVHKSLDNASLKMVRSLPDTWLPGILKGKPVSSVYEIKIPFTAI